MDRKDNGYVYFIYDVGSGLTKIGMTSSINRRWDQIKSVNPSAIPLFLINVDGCFGNIPAYKIIESGIQERYDHKRVYLEWFDMNYSNFVDFLKDKGKGIEIQSLLSKIHSVLTRDINSDSQYILFHEYRHLQDVKTFKWTIYKEVE